MKLCTGNLIKCVQQTAVSLHLFTGSLVLFVFRTVFGQFFHEFILNVEKKILDEEEEEGNTVEDLWGALKKDISRARKDSRSVDEVRKER